MIKTPAEWVIWRIKETFSFTMNNLRGIMLPLIIINLIMALATVYWVGLLMPLSIIWIVLWIAFFIAYIILSVWVNIWIIKYISNNMNSDTSGWDCKESMSYWFSNILKWLKVWLWYVIIYLILPILLLIIWYILVIMWSASALAETSTIITYALMWVGSIMLLVSYIWFIIKALKIVFVMYHAVDKDDYSKKQFNKSISYTKNNWWRILWNLLLASLVFGLIYFAMVFTTTFYTTLNPNAFSPILTLAIELVNWLLAALFGWFIAVFSYLLAKRLEFEAEWEVDNENTVLKEKSVEL